jgi:autotransporter adhesin
VHYDDADRSQVTLAGAGGTRIANLADGVSATDAANLRQVRAGDAATLRNAHDYTDQKFASINLEFGEVRDQLDHQDRRIDRLGAMSAAMTNMAASAAGVRSTNRVAVGVGNHGSSSAFALGYQRAFSDRAVITVGGAFDGDERQVGMGAAFGW